MEIPYCRVRGWRLLFVPGWLLIFPLVSHSAETPMPRFVDSHRLEAHVRMLSESLAPRDAAHPTQLDRVAAYVQEEFVRAQATVVDQPFHVGGISYRNVVARYGPETRECVVVGAHYDAAGPYPGADDNASGVAGLLALAFVLRTTSLPRTVELVAYTLEEPPFFGTAQMGSAIHARALRERGVTVRTMFSLEMIGYFTDGADTQQFPLPGLSWRYPSTGNFIAVVGKLGQGGLVRRVERAMAQASPLPVFSLTAPRSLPGVGLSDHANYWHVGYPAVMITDTAFYRNPHYHTRMDTADTLDYRRMAQVVEGVYAAVKATVK
jgi:Zn-dependent M28 family amino/carboxypeptidase